MTLPRERVVVLIPAHNEAEAIAATIEGIRAQHRQADDVVVICDNCTDDTRVVASKHPVRVVEASGNRHGKAGALNWAWRTFAEDADVVVCIDADTWLPANAIGDWVDEFRADGMLGGSSSKFTMRGRDFLVRLQRAEFARWTDTNLARGWTSVLAGTACAIRNSALREVAGRDDRDGPWTYASSVEDFELTYRIRELGYACRVSPDVRAYTDAMRSVRSLWAQRMKWQTGTVEDLLRFGVSRLTVVDWLQQLAGLAAALVRVAWVVVMCVAVALHAFTFNGWWLLAAVIFAMNDVKHARRIPDRDHTDVLLAAALVPQELFAWIRAGWFMAGWAEVLVGKVTGRRRDRWSLQYAAESRQ